MLVAHDLAQLAQSLRLTPEGAERCSTVFQSRNGFPFEEAQAAHFDRRHHLQPFFPLRDVLDMGATAQRRALRHDHDTLARIA